MRPDFGRSRPAIERSVVVLPQPLGAEQGEEVAFGHADVHVLRGLDRLAEFVHGLGEEGLDLKHGVASR